MLTRTKFAVAALLLVGSVGGAFAQAPYGDNRPVRLRTYGPAALGAYGYGPAWGSYAYAPGPVARRAAIAGRARGAYAYAPGAWGAYAAAPASAPSSDDWMKVYEAGKLIGQDPDPNVRMMLSKDFTYQ